MNQYSVRPEGTLRENQPGVSGTMQESNLIK